MADEILVQASELGAIRGERILYRGISLAAGAGQLIILRGTNGSGKTTLLRQLAGLSTPESGSIKNSKPHHWLGHSNGLKAHETPRSHLAHWKRVWGSAASIDDVLRATGIERPADVPTQMLSAGQKRRTALARLKLSHRPLWLLDEPFNALDLQGQTLLAEMIQTHCADGGAVIAALHGSAPVIADKEITL